MSFRNTIVTPTYATWGLVPCNASLKSGDILPDGSMILFGNRTESWGGYDVDEDSPQFPTTAKDMATMQKFDGRTYVDDDVKGTQARQSKWFTEYKKDLESAPPKSEADDIKIYKDTFK